MQETSDWHIAAARARGRAKASPYAPVGAGPTHAPQRV